MDSVVGVNHYSGACHCGAVSYRFSTARALPDLVPRACDCDFCTAHAAFYISDPQGSLTLHLRDHARLYQQGSNTADFVICARCGVLTCVLCRVDQHLYAVINARTIEAETAPPQTMRLDDQSAPQRLSRRRKTWIGNVFIKRETHLDEAWPSQ